MPILKKSNKEPVYCSCCGRELKVTGTMGFLLKAAVSAKTGNDLTAMKQEYLLDPEGKGMGNKLFNSMREESKSYSEDMPLGEKGNVVLHFKAGERILCENCCESVLYSMLGEPVDVMEFAIYPRAKFDILYSKMAEMDIDELKERSHKLEEAARLAQKEEEKAINEWADSLK